MNGACQSLHSDLFTSYQYLLCSAAIAGLWKQEFTKTIFLFCFQPKSAKPLFVVFRALHTGDKILHIYSNDKKYFEAENPKYRLYVHDAKSVCFLTDKKSFCLSFGDGGLLFFDASSEGEAEEWVRSFNAVLFAKGVGGGE